MRACVVQRKGHSEQRKGGASQPEAELCVLIIRDTDHPTGAGTAVRPTVGRGVRAAPACRLPALRHPSSLSVLSGNQASC